MCASGGLGGGQGCKMVVQANVKPTRFPASPTARCCRPMLQLPACLKGVQVNFSQAGQLHGGCRAPAPHNLAGLCRALERGVEHALEVHASQLHICMCVSTA